MADVTLGTIIHGTLLASDLAPEFLSELARHDAKSAAELSAEWETIDPDSDDAPEFVADVSDRINEFAPDYLYFGSHVGDGSDFGWWVCEDIESMFRDDGVEVVSDLADIESRRVAVVNDHGNVTFGILDSDGFREVWSTV